LVFWLPRSHSESMFSYWLCIGCVNYWSCASSTSQSRHTSEGDRKNQNAGMWNE